MRLLVMALVPLHVARAMLPTTCWTNWFEKGAFNIMQHMGQATPPHRFAGATTPVLLIDLRFREAAQGATASCRKKDRSTTDTDRLTLEELAENHHRFLVEARVLSLLAEGRGRLRASSSRKMEYLCPATKMVVTPDIETRVTRGGADCGLRRCSLLLASASEEYRLSSELVDSRCTTQATRNVCDVHLFRHQYTLSRHRRLK